MNESDSRDLSESVLNTLILTPISFKWNPVHSIENVPYSFPNEITDYMKSNYKSSTVYRWVLVKSDGTIRYYIGQTDRLAPRRIRQYLKPGPTQKTSQRIHDELNRTVINGGNNRLEHLTFSQFTINNQIITQVSLSDPHTRKFLEELFTVLAKANGEILLNK